MIRFVKLKHRDGEPIWVNPSYVMSVVPVFNERGDSVETGSAVTTNRGTIVTRELCGDIVKKLEGGLM